MTLSQINVFQNVNHHEKSLIIISVCYHFHNTIYHIMPIHQNKTLDIYIRINIVDFRKF